MTAALKFLLDNSNICVISILVAINYRFYSSGIFRIFDLMCDIQLISGHFGHDVMESASYLNLTF